MSVQILHGDALELLPTLSGLDACVCDPPYHLTSIVKRFGSPNAAPAQFGTDGAFARASRGFMNKQWDGGATAFHPETWRLVLNAMKPGAYIIAFASTRGYHRMACAIEDAGFITHPMIGWIFGSGFPKATRIKAPGTEHLRYGLQALKPALEPIYMGQKPMEGAGTENWLKHGTGALNIDACRVPTDETIHTTRNVALGSSGSGVYGAAAVPGVFEGHQAGRWPANLCHDGSDEVLALFPAETGISSGGRVSPSKLFGMDAQPEISTGFGDSGSAARFFFCAPPEQDELIIWRAKTILCQWNKELADTADTHSSLSKRAVFSALSDAVILASQGVIASIPSSWTGHFMDATPSELRRLSETCIALILSLDSGFWQGSPREKRFLSGVRARVAAATAQTGTMTITLSHWKSDGSAADVTFNTTRQNLAHGAKDFAGSRFHYCAKADADDRAWSKHPTVKPLALMRWLVRLVTPPGGTVLDCFAGSGTTGEAARLEGFNAVLIEREAEYVADIRRRMGRASGDDAPLFAGAA